MFLEVGSLTRRGLLRLFGAAPLALLGFGWSGTRTMAQEIADECEEACNYHTACTGQPVNSADVISVVEMVWGKFLLGLDGTPVKDGVFHKAFELSGSFLICNLDDIMASPDDTNACCVRCGEIAREKPWLWFALTPEQFEEAWCKTQEEMVCKLERAARISGNGVGGGLLCS